MNKTKKIRHLRAKVEDLRAELEEIYVELEDRADAALFAQLSADEWRAKYEQLMLTPEIKADTEAAFNRGVAHARKSMASYLIEALQNISLKESK